MTQGTKLASTRRFRFFNDQMYHFQTLRALNDIPYGGADTAEILQTIGHIKAGDADSWYSAWEGGGDRVSELVRRTQDPISRGRALLRAHNYYRTAEFLLKPRDPRRAGSWKKNVGAYEGLDTLGIKYERISAPYGQHHLNALYFPGPKGSEKRPLIVICGGFDSTLEELYFILVAAGLERGYSVLAYEGPGQGSIIRDQGVPFTYEWEKPTAVILDAHLRTHGRPEKIVLVGMSMGGYLAPRAAAFDDRVDGVVAFDVLYDFAAAASRTVPPIAFWLGRHGLGFLLNAIVKIKAAFSPGVRWAVQNSMWVMGTHDLLATLEAFQAYTLDGVAQHIKGDVPILAGEDDHFVPVEQVNEFRGSLTQARSVTTSTIVNPAVPNTVSSALPHSGTPPSSIGCVRNSRRTLEWNPKHYEDSDMNPASKWPPSSIVLTLAGVALTGVGLYFIALRPALLPEDVRYMSLSGEQIDAIRPRLDAWLTHVFRVMGGYIFATGALTVTLAATSFREHRWSAAIGALIGGAASIGLMATINFMIDSDFKWALLAIALVWACSLGLFLFEKEITNVQKSAAVG